MDKDDPIGKTYLKLTVLSRADNDAWGHRKWNCACSCGKKRCVATRQLGKTESCGCAKWDRQRGSNVKGCGEIKGSFVCHLRSGAKRRKIPFTVSSDEMWNLFLSQNRICKISGIPLHFGEGKLCKGRNASLDRIDSSRGYVTGNIQWLDRRINVMKQELSQSEFIALVERIHNFNQGT